MDSSKGLVAGFVDIGAKWMSHWRTGVCTPALWLNREQCCWSSTDVEFDDVHNEICRHVSVQRVPSFDMLLLLPSSGKHGRIYLE